MEAIILLLIIMTIGLIPGFISNNSFTTSFDFDNTVKSVVIAAGILILILLVKEVLILIGSIEKENNFFDEKLFPTLKSNIMLIGIILITMYAFLGIATGDIKTEDFIKAITNYKAIIAVIAGILVTQFAKYGVNFMTESPDLVSMIIIGIIIGVVVFDGVATGPLIASGIAVSMFFIIDTISKILS